MKRTAIKRVGKIGRANIEARKMIAKIAEEHNLTTCEIRFAGCLGTFGIAPAHRHRRGYYHGDPKKLADYNEWVAACQHCHGLIDNNKQLLKETFNRLR